MKKWVDRDWSELRDGDTVRKDYGGDWKGSIYEIEHIGSRYLKAKEIDGLLFEKPIPMQIYNGCKYQRLEEVESPDGWYLVRDHDGEELCVVKHGCYCYLSEKDRDNRHLSIRFYKFEILKRVEFKDLE